MEKKIVLIILLFLSISIFVFGYDEEMQVAREFTRNKDYKNADETYKKLMSEKITKELIMEYSNMLIWSGQIEKAIKILKEFNEEDTEIELQKAFIYTIKKDYTNAVKIYKKYEKTGEIDKRGNDFLDFYNNFYRNEIKLICSPTLDNKGKISTVSDLYYIYDYYKLWSFVFYKEYLYNESNLKLDSNNLEAYYKKTIISLGNSSRKDIKNVGDYYVNIEQSISFLTLGLKYRIFDNDKDISYLTILKIKLDQYFGAINVNETVNITNNGDKFYQLGLLYKNVELRYYFDLVESSTLTAKYKNSINKRFSYEFGISEDLYYNSQGITAGIGMKF